MQDMDVPGQGAGLTKGADFIAADTLKRIFLPVLHGAWAESWRIFKVLHLWECKDFCEDEATCKCWCTQRTHIALELPQGTSLCVVVNVCDARIDILGVTIPISFKEHQL